MKRNKKYTAFRWLSAPVFLLAAAACTDHAQLDLPGQSNGTNIITFTLQPESQSLKTRAGKSLPHISDGSKADILIFAVYDENGNLLKEFQKETDVPETFPGEGQNVIHVNKYPVQIQLSIDTGRVYKVAFWAQSSQTAAYDTQDLTKVKVNYNEARNNDELRDAFCASITVKGSKNSQEVTLRRPLAQVNVGTAGWDYEAAAALPPGAVIYTQSQITLEGVAQYYNVLNGSASEDDLTTATFAFHTIPAFINVDPDKLQNELIYTPFDEEEYLKVNRDDNIDIEKYVGWDAYKQYSDEYADLISKGEKPQTPATETFKYLSMCYVLVPEPAQDQAQEGIYSAVLNKVSFQFKGVDENDQETTFPKDGNLFEVNNVPVQKNWRTNILGTSFFSTVVPFIIDVVPDYYGDHNYNYEEDDDWNEKENPDRNFPEDDDYYDNQVQE